MGSVKDLIIEKEPTETELGVGVFAFSDRYSIFDWGEMPDLIPGKGDVLATLGAYNFELLERNGLETHYRGLVEDGGLVGFDNVNNPVNKMSIDLAYKPLVERREKKYHYEELTGKDNFLIPLEIVFRNYVPVGSSIRRRYEPRDIVLDYPEWPEQEIKLEQPIVEFSTKLESQDRYLSEEEAYGISGLSEGKFEELGEIATEVNRHLTDYARKRNFKHLDGKIECIYDHGKIAVADVAGTFDENRFSYLGTQISKEILRQWYKKKDPTWYEEVVSAKKGSRGDNSDNWTRYVSEKPRSIDPELKELIAEMYKAGANKWMGKSVFDAEDLSKVVEELDTWKMKENL